MKRLALILTVIFSGCTTIHFDNINNENNAENVAENASERQSTEQWHHILALDLYELSEPVDLQESCAQQSWSSVKTELTFLNGLSSFGANLLAPIWYPKTVTIECQDKT